MTEEDIRKKYLPVPYKHQGRDLSGLDCYGLVICIYKDLGVKLFDIEEDYSIDWGYKNKNYVIENYYKEWEEVKIPRLFDGVVFKNGKGIMSHMGIMLSNNRFINSCKAGVVVCNLSDSIWRKRFYGFYRYKGLIKC
jgi:cell wall-associated NlpC family hydrolase